MKKIALGIAAGTLLAADAVLLLGVAARPRATPDAVLELSEREMPMQPHPEEHSAVMLDLRWRSPGSLSWLTPGKLDDLGLTSERSGPRPVFAVLEIRPEAPEGGTRLAIIDAGREAGSLRARYPDRKRYAIIRATARRNGYAAERAGLPGWLMIEPAFVWVPRQYADVFRGLRGSEATVTKPRYGVTLCFGADGSFWICGAKRY